MKTPREIISEHPFFAGMAPAQLEAVIRCASEVKFETDQIVFREGEPANQFFLLQSGHIALEAHEPGDGSSLIQTLGPGDVLGWSWLFPPFVWHFQARATETTLAVVLNGGHLLRMAERDHEFGFELMKRLSQVLIHRLQATREQLIQQQLQAALEA